MDPNHITYFAETDARNKKIRFGIKAKDRLKHVYVIGKTGMGKSTLLENMAIQDIQNGNGLAFIDPHGGTAEKLLDYVPESRVKDVLYFAPFDLEFPVSFNVMEDVGGDKRHLVVAGLMATFEKIWADAWSARMAYILQNTLGALLEYPGATLLGVNRMYTDKDFRKKVVDNITDVAIKTFWTEEYTKFTDRYTQEATPAIQNKVGQFASNPLVRNIVGQSKSSFDLRKMMDEKKILIINLSKGRVGEGNARLLGSMLITKIYLAAMSRADKSETELAKLPNFYLYVDEFQSFANKSFADILSEARKYRLNLTIAHQYIEQMEEEVRDAVFGNVGTMIAFRVGAYDAEVLEKEFAPAFTAIDLVNLGYIQIYLKLMIDGISSQPFSATTMAPIVRPDHNFKDLVLKNSREQFASPRVEVEKAIQDWHEEGTQRAMPKAPRPYAERTENQSPNIRPEVKEVRKEPVYQEKRSFEERRPTPVVVPSPTSTPAPAPTPTPVFREPPKVDPNKQVFMKAAEELRQKETQKKETIPLSSLREEDKKNPKQENLSSLKEALASVIKKPASAEEKPKHSEVHHEIKKSEPEVKKTESIPPERSEGNKSNKAQAAAEVPEEVLRKLLKMDENK